MMREKIKQMIDDVLKEHLGNERSSDFSVAPPENPENGDYATNVAFATMRRFAKAIDVHVGEATWIQKEAKNPKTPRELAEKIAQWLKEKDPKLFDDVRVAGSGFINFHLSPTALYTDFKSILSEREKFGEINIGKDKKARVEYVSANPTGPIHIGNARGGPIGETISRVLEKAGYAVAREYYHNDAGTQVEKMGATIWYWYRTALGEEEQFPEGGYQGEYLREVADAALRTEGRSLDLGRITQFGLEYIYTENMEVAKMLGISFDHVIKESELLASGKTAAVVEELKEKGMVTEREGAWWFAPQDEFLEDRESVVVRSTGQPTYFASDIAYHKDKFTSGADLIINIFGSNHHGHVPKLQALTKIYGFDPAQFHVVLYQYVRVKRGTEVVKMSKRAGTYVTAKEVLDEVGPDALNFFLLMHAPSTHMDFDLELARERSQQNPVFYVQYAHARCASILRTAAEEKKVPGGDTALLKEKEELDLIKKMLQLPEVVEDTARDFQVHRLTRYVTDLARAFHHFYEKHRVITDDAALTASRLLLVQATQIVLANTSRLLSIDAPEKM